MHHNHAAPHRHRQLKSHLDPSLFTLLIKFNFSLKTRYKRESFDLVVAHGVPQQFMYLSQMGEKHICVDFVQLNRVTKKDSYPVSRADRPHQRLAGKQIFSKLDLKSAYWQFPMDESSVEKTAFSPGPGYGLWEFVVLPYGLTGATQICQRGLDELFRDCHNCVDNYVEYIIIF